MKILHLGKFYYPIEGGIESINRFIVNTLSEHQQRVISFNADDRSIETDIEGVPVIRASVKGIFASQPLSLKYFRELKRNLKMFTPDIVHFHYPNPLVAIYILLNPKKYKLIVHWHSDIVAQKWLYPLIKPIEQRILKIADTIIATSPNYRDASDSLKEYKDKVTVIPCSIDESRFDLTQKEIEKVKDIKEKYNNKKIIFFIGRHVEYKGIRYLLEAERLVDEDCVFIIGGHGPLTDSLKSQYTSERIHWLGKLTEEKMKLYYHAAYIFAFPSITRNEAFGVVLAESMYCGCPAVTFTINGSGVNWVSIKDQTCIEVENKNIESYAKALNLLLSNVNLREQLSIHSRKRVNKLFVKETIYKLYTNLYEQIIKK